MILIDSEMKGIKTSRITFRGSRLRMFLGEKLHKNGHLMEKPIHITTDEEFRIRRKAELERKDSMNKSQTKL